MPPHLPHHHHPQRSVSVLAPLYVQPVVDGSNLTAEIVEPLQPVFRIVGKIYKRNNLKTPSTMLTFRGNSPAQVLALYKAHLKTLPMDGVTKVESFLEKWDGRVWRRSRI